MPLILYFCFLIPCLLRAVNWQEPSGLWSANPVLGAAAQRMPRPTPAGHTHGGFFWPRGDQLDKGGREALGKSGSVFQGKQKQSLSNTELANDRVSPLLTHSERSLSPVSASPLMKTNGRFRSVGGDGFQMGFSEERPAGGVGRVQCIL